MEKQEEVMYLTNLHCIQANDESGTDKIYVSIYCDGTIFGSFPHDDASSYSMTSGDDIPLDIDFGCADLTEIRIEVWEANDYVSAACLVRYEGDGENDSVSCSFVRNDGPGEYRIDFDNKGWKARTSFTFDPAMLTINELYLTQLYNGQGFSTARIFSNEKMHARLLLKYSYEVGLETFVNDETKAEIKAIVKAGVEEHFRNDDNLIICEAFHPNTDISDRGWKKQYEPNGYLTDLDNDPRHIDFPVEYIPDYMEAMPKTGKSQPLYNPVEDLAEPRDEIITEQDTTNVYLVFTTYVIPPAGPKTNYTLQASYRYKDEDGVLHIKDSGTVSLQTEPFNVTEDTVQLTTIACKYYTGEDENFKSFAVLYALCYRGDKYGGARPYNVTTYRGLVLEEDKNLCLSRVNDYYVTGIFYYPGKRDPYDLFACKNDIEYNDPIEADITNDELYSDNIEDLTAITAGTNDDSHWENIGGDFYEDQVRKAHHNGIPLTVRRTISQIYRLEDENDKEFEFEIARPYGIEDNCGNTFELTIKWPNYYANNYDLDPHDVEMYEFSGSDFEDIQDPRTKLYQPDFENMYKLKVWPTYP